MFKRIYISILLGLLFTGLSVLAGSLAPDNPVSPGAGSYTLSDIYEQITVGTNSSPHTFPPAITPPASSLTTLTDLWSIIPPFMTLVLGDLDSGILPAGIYPDPTDLTVVEPNLMAENIVSGITMLGIIGTCEVAPPEPFVETFEGNLDAWTTLSGSWVTSSGFLQKQTDGHQAIKVSDIDAENGIIEIEIKPFANFQGVVFRVQDDDNYYFAALHPDGDQSIWLIKKEGGVESTLAQSERIPSLNWEGTWYDFKIEYETEVGGLRVKLWLDNTLYLNYLDADPAWESGGIGCRAYYPEAYWDDFIFTFI